ncbi:hypothetical protein P3G55_07180 [Leptospira sp. 96542]|nr:hypothetical protein [Leptospira sp. 96542]
MNPPRIARRSEGSNFLHEESITDRKDSVVLVYISELFFGKGLGDPSLTLETKLDLKNESKQINSDPPLFN